MTKLMFGWERELWIKRSFSMSNLGVAVVDRHEVDESSEDKHTGESNDGARPKDARPDV